MRFVVTRELVRTSAFVRAARRYLKKHPQVDAELEASLQLLELNAFDSRLKTHKLSGELSGVWACSAGYDLRILFEFEVHEGKERIVLLNGWNARRRLLIERLSSASCQR
jgi:mRNA-degrading endonuclease YafQ of YafQ-DinJ toxin-antitoxin module